MMRMFNFMVSALHPSLNRDVPGEKLNSLEELFQKRWKNRQRSGTLTAVIDEAKELNDDSTVCRAIWKKNSSMMVCCCKPFLMKCAVRNCGWYVPCADRPTCSECRVTPAALIIIGVMHCADEGFNRCLICLKRRFSSDSPAGKLEFNKRDGFLDCPHGDRVCGGGMVSKVDIRLQLTGPLRISTGAITSKHQNFV